MFESHNRQHGRDYRSVMPTNLYGSGDHYPPENSHVIPPYCGVSTSGADRRRPGDHLGQPHPAPSPARGEGFQGDPAVKAKLTSLPRAGGGIGERGARV